MNPKMPMAGLVFFSSFSGIWAHAASDSHLMRLLSKEGFAIHSLSCDGILPGSCNVRASRSRSSVDIERDPFLDCNDCKFSSRLMSGRLNGSPANQSWLGGFLSVSDHQDAQRLRNDWSLNLPKPDTLIEGFPLVRFAAYELLLTFKVSPKNLYRDHSSQLVDAMVGSFLVLRASKKFLSDHPEIQVAIVRAPQYGVNRTFSELAMSLGVRVCYLDGSPNVSESYTHSVLKDLKEFGWSSPARLMPLPPFPKGGDSSMRRLKRHLDALESGKSHKVYSAEKSSLTPAQIRAIFGIADGKKIVLAALSSTDEPIAAKFSKLRGLDKYPGKVFPSQLEWIRWLISWASSSSDVALIIRLHPREFPNKRDSSNSSMGQMWESELGNLPSNVFLNHPEQGLSIYDLIPICRAVTTGWSSVGVEAMALGVPCITYDSSLPWYPADLGLSGDAVVDYERNLDAVIRAGQLEGETYRDKALRWLNLSMNLSSFQIGGRFLSSRRETFPFFARKLLEGIERFFYMAYKPIDLMWGCLVGPRRLDSAVVLVVQGSSPSVLHARLAATKSEIDQRLTSRGYRPEGL